MEEFELGPNGGLVYCMEYLLAHFSWLEDKLNALGSQYILFDCPGQVILEEGVYTFISLPLFSHSNNFSHPVEPFLSLLLPCTFLFSIYLSLSGILLLVSLPPGRSNYILTIHA